MKHVMLDTCFSAGAWSNVWGASAQQMNTNSIAPCAAFQHLRVNLRTTVLRGNSVCTSKHTSSGAFLSNIPPCTLLLLAPEGGGGRVRGGGANLLATGARESDGADGTIVSTDPLANTSDSGDGASTQGSSAKATSLNASKTPESKHGVKFEAMLRKIIFLFCQYCRVPTVSRVDAV